MTRRSFVTSVCGLMGIDWMRWHPSVSPEHAATSTDQLSRVCPAVLDGADQHGSTIKLSGWSAATQVLNCGDVLIFAGCLAVHPMTHRVQDYCYQFVVTDDIYSDASGVSEVSIYPALIPSGPWRNVSAAPADQARLIVNPSGRFDTLI